MKFFSFFFFFFIGKSVVDSPSFEIFTFMSGGTRWIRRFLDELVKIYFSFSLLEIVSIYP